MIKFFSARPKPGVLYAKTASPVFFLGEGLRRILPICLLLGLGLVLKVPHSAGQEIPSSRVIMPGIELEALGRVEHREGKVIVEVLPTFAPALDGIESFSHIWVIYWFHGNDSPENRQILKVHPRRNPANPLTGVFATRSPVRPNLLGLQTCRLIRREGNRLEVEGLDAWEGSPVLDIKPYLPRLDSHPEAVVPKWAEGKPPE